MQPVVGIVADRCQSDNVECDTIRVRYLEALRETADVVPVIIPSGLREEELTAVLGTLNGLVLGGATSNVDPHRYITEPVSPNEMLLDPARDSTSFGAIRVASRRKLPILGICRGLQELNVAFGGALNRDLSSGVGHRQHYEDETQPRDQQYNPVHDVIVVGEGGIAACVRNLGLTKITVNSLHRQGISRLGEGLSADLVAEDGLIEAISGNDPEWFASAVQWHPEWFHREDQLSRAIFASFGKACRQFYERSTTRNNWSEFGFAPSGYNARGLGLSK